MKLFEVGGAVRDELIGVKSKDIDYAVEMDTTISPAGAAYEQMNLTLQAEGFEIFLETPDCFTTRAKFPKGHKNEGLVADFVMCRKETGYIPGTRQPIVEVGTLMDDLERRDFTVNAIARDIETGELIDPFNGQEDLMKKKLRCPISAMTSFNDDPLRILRAIRFSITKDLQPDNDIITAFEFFDVEKLKVVSAERMYEELKKIFQHDTLIAIKALNEIKNFTGLDILGIAVENGIRLEPTMKKL